MMVTVGIIMNQVLPLQFVSIAVSLSVCQQGTSRPLAFKVNSGIRVPLLPDLSLFIYQFLSSILTGSLYSWTFSVHSQLCLCITPFYSAPQKCSFSSLGLVTSPSGSLPWTLTWHFPYFFFYCQLVFLCHILSSYATQGPRRKRHSQIGQFVESLIKGPFTKVIAG